MAVHLLAGHSNGMDCFARTSKGIERQCAGFADLGKATALRGTAGRSNGIVSKGTHSFGKAQFARARNRMVMLGNDQHSMGDEMTC